MMTLCLIAVSRLGTMGGRPCCHASVKNTCQVLRMFWLPAAVALLSHQVLRTSQLIAPYFPMSHSTGKRKRTKTSSEHRIAGATFSDPFSQTARFTTTATSTSSGSVQSTSHNVNMGRNTVPKRVRVQPTATESTPTNATNTSSDTKNQVIIICCTSDGSTYKINQTQSSVLLEQFEKQLDSLLDFILDIEADDCLGEQCLCGNGDRLYRCMDCFQSATKCSSCFISDHVQMPFHWVEKWNGEYFERMDISQIGHTISLGHEGAPCPSSQLDTSAVNFIIVDTNGVHKTRVSFCNCVDNGSRVQQLMKARLFPASTDQPTTAFSFRVLKDFHLQTLESKKSAYDYLGALRRLTNNANPDGVPVSTLQLNGIFPLI
jgi:hypothetical protein